MKKTIEIDRIKDVREGDKLYLEAAPDRAYTIINVYDGEDGLPYCIDLMEYLDDTTRRIIDWLNVTPRRKWWVSPDSVTRITRTVDAPDWPTPKHDAAPEPRHITDIREVRIGFIVFAKGFSTPFVCAFRDNAQRDVSSAFYKDSLICVSGKLPDELSAICDGSLNYCWLRNDKFDYAIAPIDSLGLGGDHE